jgi:O-antigen ligase
MPAFALLLMGRRSFLASLVVLSGLLIAVEGGSRATIGLMGSGLVVTAVLSMRHRITGRKAAFAVAAVVALALAVPATIWAVQRRSEVALESSDHERKAFTDAAEMVIADYPLGVGANQYVIVVNLGGYSDRAGAAWNPANRAAPVHDSYLLVTAEMGFLGLIGFVAMLLAGITTGLKAMRQADRSERSELMVGFVGALIIVSAHFAYEWLFMTAHVHYLLAMNMGAMAGVAASLQQSARRRQRSATAAVAPRPAS